MADVLLLSDAGSGWTYLTDLDAAKNTGPAGRSAPELKLQQSLERVRIIRISFAAGDEMADHKAPAPIVVVGQVGEVEMTIHGDDTETTVSVRPGTAVHVAAQHVHSLRAQTPSVVTLMLLTD